MILKGFFCSDIERVFCSDIDRGFFAVILKGGISTERGLAESQ